MYAFVPAELDATAVTGALTELGTQGGLVVAAGIAVSVGIFGVLFLWRKARTAVN